MITSPQNQRVKDLVRLRDRRHRERTGRFLVEGYRELSRALDGGVDIVALYTCPDLHLGSNEPSLVARAADAGAEIVELAEAPFRKVSYRDRPEGLIAEAGQFDVSLDRVPLDGDPLILVVESIEKPGNLGTMLRTADAAGCRGVLVADPTTDPFNPNVVRASIGTLFTVPLAVGGTGEVMDRLRAGGVRMAATTPDASTPIFGADLTGPVAVVVGSEQYGLSRAWLDGSDIRLSIPMAGRADSLNAAMAAAIALFEAVRQRS
jgi:RNA methyltransferase, TrmH family